RRWVVRTCRYVCMYSTHPSSILTLSTHRNVYAGNMYPRTFLPPNLYSTPSGTSYTSLQHENSEVICIYSKTNDEAGQSRQENKHILTKLMNPYSS
ncbi:hypothetical protein T310_6048, partial [Rasamsonia emersonii CBS 393.64]